MPCHRIAGGIVCISPCGRLHVGNRYIFMDFHEYCGPSFYTKERGKEVDYEPADEKDPVWPEFEKWHTKFQAAKAKRAATRTTTGKEG